MNGGLKVLQEVRKLLRERLTLLLMAILVTGAVWFSLNGTGKTAADAYIVNPGKNSAFLGAFLFSLLTLVQFHREFKNHTEVMVLTITDPILHQVRRTLSLLCTAIVATLLISLFTLPYGMVKTGDYFQLATFFTAWFLIFLGALIISVLLSAGLYLFTRRFEVSFILMIGLILLSKLLNNMHTLNPSYLFYWVQTTAINFSDLITNQFQIDMLLWNRLFCLLVSLSIWTLGLCSFRRYGYNFLSSFLMNCRRLWIPGLLIITISLSGVSYAFEPIFNDSKPMDFSGMISSGTGLVTTFSMGAEEEIPDLSLTEKEFHLDVDGKGRSLSGIAIYQLKNATGEAQTLSIQTNTGINIDSLFINGTEGKALRGETGERSTANWSLQLPAAEAYKIEIHYSGRMGNDNTLVQRATNGIAEGYVWLPAIGTSPSLDVHVADDCSFFGTLSLDEGLEPVFTMGKAVKGETKEGKTQWQYTGRRGTQGASVIAAQYMTKTFEAGGLQIELKHFAKHDRSIGEMDAVAVIQSAIDYFTRVYGPLIYQKSLTILELPAYVSGGFAGGNTSAMDETSFSEKGYLPVDSLTPHSGGGIDVLVHEIAHQWWGIATMPIQDGTSCWSAEGITCYSTYSFMKEYFGEAYVEEHYLKGWQQDWKTYQNAFYVQHPEYLTKLSEKDVSNIMASFQDMRLYSLMPLMMLKGEAALGGTEAYQQKLAQLYLSHLARPIPYSKAP